MKLGNRLALAAAAAGCFALVTVAVRAQQAARPQVGKEYPATPPAATINLMTREGVDLVKGQWRYSDAKIVEVPFRYPDGRPNTTYDISPKAGAANFDDSSWQVLDPTTLGQPRSTGKICFNWYRIRITIPERIGDFDPRGAIVVFDTIVDDYGEVWVNGQLPRSLGQTGGSVVKGFNAPNRLVIDTDAQPGEQIQLAVFGINSPISAAPENWIFLRYAKLDFYKP